MKLNLNKKAVDFTAEKLIFILLTIAIAVIIFIVISRMAPHLFDSLKELLK